MVSMAVDFLANVTRNSLSGSVGTGSPFLAEDPATASADDDHTLGHAGSEQHCPDTHDVGMVVNPDSSGQGEAPGGGTEGHGERPRSLARLGTGKQHCSPTDRRFHRG
jgi:hypothetical protein